MKTPTGPGIERPRLGLDVFSVGVIGGMHCLGVRFCRIHYYPSKSALCSVPEDDHTIAA